MPKEAKVTRGLQFSKYSVTLTMIGPLHATSPSSPEGVKYMLGNMPSGVVLEQRKAVGEPITLLEELETQVLEEVGAAGLGEAPEPMSVFRRDKDGNPFLHPNFIKGHLRDAADATSRAVQFWGFQAFVTSTLFVRPLQILLKGKVQLETWPTHFDIYRKGRVSSFRKAEYVEDSILSFRVYLVSDPRWTDALFQQLWNYGAIRGLGGGRGRGMGQYEFTLDGPQTVLPAEVWEDK